MKKELIMGVCRVRMADVHCLPLRTRSVDEIASSQLSSMNKSAKKLAFVSIRVAVSVFLIYFIISKVGWAEIRENLRMLDPVSFAFVLVLFVMSIIIMTLRLKLFIPWGINIKELFNITYVGTFFNTCLPGSVGGDIVKAYYLSKALKNDPLRGNTSEKMTRSEQNSSSSTAGHNVTAFGSVVIDRYVGLITLLFIGIMATFLGSKYFSDHPVRWLIPVLLGIVVIVSIAVFKLRIGRSFPVVSEIYAYTDEVAFRKKEILLKAFLYSIATQMIMICSVYILSRGLSMAVPFMSVLCFVPVVSIISLIPVTISGIGLREGAFVVLFGLIGILPEKAMTLSIVWFLSIAVGSLPGLVGYLLFHKTLSGTITKEA